MTLLVRDEADIVDEQISFHLDAGVDFVVATDNRSQDGTTEILERHAREGHLHLIREPGDDLRQTEWVTRMAQLAATDFGADWVINTDADEFWWPQGFGVEGGPGRRPGALRRRARRVAQLRPAPRRRATVPRATDRAARDARVPPPPAEHALEVGAPRDRRRPGRAREPRGVRDRPAAAPRLVPDRDPALPRALAGALRAEVRDPVRRAGEERGEGDPGAHGGGVPGVARRPARGVLRAARGGRRGARARSRGRQPRAGHEAPRPAARARRGVAERLRPARRGRRRGLRRRVPALLESDLALAYGARIDGLEQRVGTLERGALGRLRGAARRVRRP